jgi:hypothetical protein
MGQALIVEGNDAIVIANLLRKRKLPPPIGYEVAQKFKEKFVKTALGVGNLRIALEEVLNDNSLTNIGIIIDADDKGYQQRLKSVQSMLQDKLGELRLEPLILPDGGQVLYYPNLVIGIWIMPNNQNEGYLEHFLAKLIPETDALWPLAEKQIETLKQMGLQAFSEPKKQKALLHTWLAWQQEPGKPFGQAAELGYFDINADVLLHFEAWFKATFRLALA